MPEALLRLLGQYHYFVQIYSCERKYRQDLAHHSLEGGRRVHQSEWYLLELVDSKHTDELRLLRAFLSQADVPISLEEVDRVEHLRPDQVVEDLLVFGIVHRSAFILLINLLYSTQN